MGDNTGRGWIGGKRLGRIARKGLCVPKSVGGRVGPDGGSCPRMGGFGGTYVGGRLVAAGQSISKKFVRLADARRTR